MKRWKVYRHFPDGRREYVGSMTARFSKKVQSEYAAFHRCAIEDIEVVDSEKAGDLTAFIMRQRRAGQPPAA
jgi:hypothetical protein